MIIDELEKKLKELGYNRENEEYPVEDSGIIKDEDFTSKVLNHTSLKNHKIIDTIFDSASATGSIYECCDFIQCSINQTDFEYCEFRNCNFESNKETIASFNNSNFENTRFNNDTVTVPLIIPSREKTFILIASIDKFLLISFISSEKQMFFPKHIFT